MNKSKVLVKGHKNTLSSKLFLAVIAAIILLIGSNVFGSTSTATAHGNTLEEPVSYKYYKSIEIQPGDTLWSIAETYRSGNSSGISIYEYISEVRQINSLESDSIQDSSYLTVPYYETEFK